MFPNDRERRQGKAAGGSPQQLPDAGGPFWLTVIGCAPDPSELMAGESSGKSRPGQQWFRAPVMRACGRSGHSLRVSTQTEPVHRVEPGRGDRPL